MIWIMADAKRIVVGQPEPSLQIYKGLGAVDWFDPLVIGVVAYIVFANVLGFSLMRADKSRAAAGQWRISEATLLLVALFGGAIGAAAAGKMYRHKTRKQPFATLLSLAGIVNHTVFVILVGLLISRLVAAVF